MSNETKITLNPKELNNKVFAFSAIDPFKVSAIPSAKETEGRGQDWIVYGDRNAYPNFLYSLYQEDATLQSIVDGMIDFCKGEEIHLGIDLG